jgi:hypothetical protein
VIETYLSHSWRPADIGLNVLVWEALAHRCALSVDREGSERRQGGVFINRLEYLIGQCQAFVAVLAYRDEPRDPARTPHGFDLKCSAPSLFEVRLAERARKPRLVIYDQRTRFRPPRPGPNADLVTYLPVNAARELDNGGAQVRPAVDRWLAQFEQYRDLGHLQPRTDVTVYVEPESDPSGAIRAAIRDGLRDSRFATVHEVEPWHLDSEVIQMLQTTDLLVAEVGSADASVLGVAHALFTPTIRFTVAAGPPARLPTLLTGHPFGYERDIFCAETVGVLSEAIRDRIAAMDRDRYLIKDRAEGLAYFRKYLTKPDQVFVSHNLPDGDRPLTERVVARLREHGIPVWEYRNEMKNSSGAVWEERLVAAMRASTHVVFIAGADFEARTQCARELAHFAAERGLGEGNVFPFLRGGRLLPIPPFQHLNNTRLPDEHGEAAEVVVRKVVGTLKPA